MQRTRKLGAIALILCMILSLFPTANAENALETATYTGSVVDSDGHPLSGVLVRDEQGGSVKTDGQGRWSMILSAGKPHTFTFTKEGYVFYQSLTIDPAEDAQVDCGVMRGAPVAPPDPPKKPEPPVQPDPKPADPEPNRSAPEKSASNHPPAQETDPQQASAEKPSQQESATPTPAPQAPSSEESATQEPPADEPSPQESATPTPAPQAPSPEESATQDPPAEEPSQQESATPTPAPQAPSPEEPAAQEPPAGEPSAQEGALESDAPASNTVETSSPSEQQSPPSTSPLGRPSWIHAPSLLAADTGAFSWTAVEGAESYTVALYDLTGDRQALAPYAQTGTSVTFAYLESGHRYRLSVQATAAGMPDGSPATCEFDCSIPAPDMNTPQNKAEEEAPQAADSEETGESKPEPIALAAPSLTAPSGTIGSLPVAISWEPVEHAASYAVEVRNAQGELLADLSGQAGTSVSLDIALQANAQYTVFVQALPAIEDAGHLAGEKGSLSFVYAPPEEQAPADSAPADQGETAQPLTFTLSENAIQAGASVQFTVHSASAAVTLLVNGAAVEQYPVEQGTASFSRAFDQAGEYRLAVTDGTATSAEQLLTVQALTLQAPEILELGEPAILAELTVSWQGDPNAQQYALDLSLQGEGGWQSVWSLTLEAGVTQFTLPANALAQAGSYRLRVTASAQGRQDASAERAFTIEEEAAIAPPMVMRAAVIMPFFTAPDAVVNTPSVPFNWHPVEGAAYYRLSLRVKSTNAYLFRDVQVNGLSYVYNGTTALVDQAQYVASIYAVYANGSNSASAQCEFIYRSSGGTTGRTPLQTPVIALPSGDVSAIPFTISWSPVADAASYQIALYDGNTQLNVINARTLPAGTTSFTVDESLASAFVAGHTYLIYVSASPSSGNALYLQSAWATKAFVYRPSSRLATPVITYPTEGASITPASGNRVTFTWNAVPNAARYAVYLNEVLLDGNVKTTYYTVNNLGVGTHAVKVQALKLGGASHADDSEVARRTFNLLPLTSPSILSISVSPGTVSLGQNFTLYFEAGNVASDTVVGLSGTGLSDYLGNISHVGSKYVWTLSANVLGVGTHNLQLTLTQGGSVTPSSLSATLTVQPARLSDPVLDPIPDQRAGTPISVSWTAVEGAARYDVYLRRGNQLIWSGSTASPTITIPATHTATPSTYGLTVLALPPSGAQTGQGMGSLYFNIVTGSIQPWTGWIQRQSATLYRSPSALYPIGYVLWNQPVRVIAESGIFYQVVVDAQNGLSGYVLKQLVGANPWSPCADGNHEFVTKYESTHPHREYVECKLCGYWFYTGRVMSNGPASECCYCGNHLWGPVVANKKHPHSTGTQTCERCGTQRTVTLTNYKLRGCSQCYPSTATAKPSKPTPTPTPSVRYDALGNRLYDTSGFRTAFGSTAERNKSYAYVSDLYDVLRTRAAEDTKNNIAQPSLRVLLSAIFTPYEAQWHTAQYDLTREAVREKGGIAYLTYLVAEACAKQDIRSAPDGLQQAAGHVGQVLAELLSVEEVLDLEARAFLTVLQEQCMNLAASTPAVALTGISEQDVHSVLQQLLRDIPYDTQVADDTLAALSLTLGEPDNVRALRVVYALAEGSHRDLNALLASLPAYATYDQLEAALLAYQEYLLSMAQLHAFAALVTDSQANAYASYQAADQSRKNAVMAAYEATFSDD